MLTSKGTSKLPAVDARSVIVAGAAPAPMPPGVSGIVPLVGLTPTPAGAAVDQRTMPPGVRRNRTPSVTVRVAPGVAASTPEGWVYASAVASPVRDDGGTSAGSAPQAGFGVDDNEKSSVVPPSTFAAGSHGRLLETPLTFNDCTNGAVGDATGAFTGQEPAAAQAHDRLREAGRRHHEVGSARCRRVEAERRPDVPGTHRAEIVVARLAAGLVGEELVLDLPHHRLRAPRRTRVHIRPGCGETRVHCPTKPWVRSGPALSCAKSSLSRATATDGPPIAAMTPAKSCGTAHAYCSGLPSA